MLNWSYQSTKPCSVLVGENPQFIPASKSATSEANLSTSSRPKTSSASGGNFLELVYDRKRRQVSNPPHAFVLSTTSDSTVDPYSLTSEHDTKNIEHASTLTPLLHDTTKNNNGTETPLMSVTNNATWRNHTPKTYNITTTSPPPEKPVEIDEKDITTDFPTTTDNYQFDFSEDHSFLDDESQLQDDPDTFFVNADDSKIHESPEAKIKTANELPDSPLIAYGEEEIHIIKLFHQTSTTEKSKSATTQDNKMKENNSKELTDANLSAFPNSGLDIPKKSNRFNDPLLMHDIRNATNSKTVTTKQVDSIEQPHVKVIEVPSISTTPSKRLLVNVTIATDPDPNNPYAAQSVYVLSVSVPTDDIAGATASENVKHSFQKEESDKKPTLLPNLENQELSGGGCECSCPCLGESGEVGVNMTDYDYVDDLLKNNMKMDYTSTIESSSVTDLTEPTEASETSTSSTKRPELTTKLPPPPTILILEGRVRNKISSLAN